MSGYAFSFHVGKSAKKAGPSSLRTLTLSGSTIVENSTENTVVGAIQNKLPTSTVTMTDTAGGRFKLSGNNVVVGATPSDYETATSYNIILRETMAGVAGSPKDTVIAIAITDVNELLALTLSANTITHGAAENTVVGVIQNKFSGSTLSLVDDASGHFKLTGTNIVAGATAADFSQVSSYSITVRETLAGAYNTPRDTVLTVNVAFDPGVVATAVAVYEPSDMTSCFIGASGGLPITANSQAVGLIYDKKQMGGLTAAAFVTAQPETRSSGTVGITGTATAATYNTATGAGTANRVNGSNVSRVVFSPAYAIGIYKFDIENFSTDAFTIRDGAGTSLSTVPGSTRTTIQVSQTLASPSFWLMPTNDGTSISFTVHSLKFVPGYHRSQPSSSKRPNYIISGSLSGLLYDGLDDCLPTIVSVDLTGTDAVTVCAGSRKLSDVAFASFIEHGPTAASTNGTFGLLAPYNAGPSFGIRSRGTAFIDAPVNTGYASPTSAILTGQSDISLDQLTLRVNGVQVATNSADQGTGNYTSQIINFGSRNNGASAPYNGIEYSSFLAGSILSGTTLNAIERWTSLRAGVPSLNTLTLSVSSLATGAAENTVVGALVGITSGSTLSLLNDAGGRFKISGSNIVAGATPTLYATAQSHQITVRETFALAPNNPKDTTFSIDVTFTPSSIATALAFYNPSDITSVFQDNLGSTAITTDDQVVGLILDKKNMAGKTAAQFITDQTNNRSSGTTTFAGTGTSSYNTTTGVGVTTRAGDTNNIGSVQFTSLTDAGNLYRIDIENTGTSDIGVRSGTSVIAATIPPATRTVVFIPSGATSIRINGTVNSTTQNFTIHSFKTIPGFHRAQSSSSKKPKWKLQGGLSYIAYDGSDDCLPTVGLVNSLSGTDQITVSTGLRKATGNVGAFAELSTTSSTSAGSFGLIVPTSTDAAGVFFRMRGTASSDISVTTGLTAPITCVLTGRGQISTDTNTLRKDGVQIGSQVSDQGTGSLSGSYRLFVGARNDGASLPFTGNEYGLFLATTMLTGNDLANIERWNGIKAGI